MGEKKQQLERITKGLAHLDGAMQGLLVSDEERVWLEKVKKRNLALKRELVVEAQAEDSAARKVLREAANARSAAKKAKSEEVHKVSGFTDYVKRVTGSFGSGRS